MINLPFDKWKLNFHSSEFETAYEDHQNKISLLSFRIINLFITIAALVGVITFLAQQQSLNLTMYMASIASGSFLLLLLSRKLQPRLKQVFSLYYLWSVTGFIFVAYNGFQVPQFVIGFNCCSTALGALQYSDNRIKIVFSLLTPLALLIVFGIFEVFQLPFLFLTIACTLFLGFQTYTNEYTSRLAFSLNLIANKQKDLINELISDGIVAISLQKISRQFLIEFHNNKFLDILQSEHNFQLSSNQQINQNHDEKIKQFLRSSYVISEIKENEKKQLQKNLQKYQKLEDYCFEKMKNDDNCLDCKADDQNLEIAQQIKDDIIFMELSIKKLNFGKPILLLVCKSIHTNEQIKQYENIINDYKSLIIVNTEKSLENLIKVQKKVSQYQFYNKQEHQTEQKYVDCLFLNQINYLRNFILYFKRNFIIKSTSKLQGLFLNPYIQTIEQYFLTILKHKKIKFEIQNYLQKNYQINLNTQFLTQLLMNIFDEIYKHNNVITNIILKIDQGLNNDNELHIEQSFCQVKKTNVNREESQILQASKIEQQLISFTFLVQSIRDIKTRNNIQKIQILNEDRIFQEVNQLLLSKLGPLGVIKFAQNNSPNNLTNYYSISFQIYSDSSVIEPSFSDYIQR